MKKNIKEEIMKYIKAIEQDEDLKREFGPEIVEIIKEIELRALQSLV